MAVYLFTMFLNGLKLYFVPNVKCLGQIQRRFKKRNEKMMMSLQSGEHMKGEGLEEVYSYLFTMTERSQLHNYSRDNLSGSI